jgi:hypothetical protein
VVGLNFLPAWNKIEKNDVFLVHRRLPVHTLNTQLANIVLFSAEQYMDLLSEHSGG